MLSFTDLVLVNYENIAEYGQYNFDVLNYETYGLLYDWKSITHYRNKAFRKVNAFGYTIESNVSYNSRQREITLRDSLQIFITLHKARLYIFEVGSECL